ncbi:MAG: DUF1616 domain-containing protein [Nitrososphaerota archaeon]|jgi:uncharacterized membrane protein|nr:DUF1616 domain-containing protein [Nitrososphaerota archaeon]
MGNKHVWYWLVMVITIVTVVAIFAIPAGSYSWGFLRQILGALFILFLPGFAFTQLLHSMQPSLLEPWRSDKLVHVGLSLGLSIALVALTGLALNYTPWGIRLTPVTFSIAALTMVSATLAVICEHIFKQNQ